MKRADDISKLANIPKKEAFSPPEGYLDALDDRILSKVDEQGARGWSLSIWYGAVAAAMALLISFNLLFQEDENMDAVELLAEVSDADIAQYLESSEVTIYELMDELNSLEIEEEETVLPELELTDEELDMILYKYDISG